MATCVHSYTSAAKLKWKICRVRWLNDTHTHTYPLHTHGKASRSRTLNNKKSTAQIVAEKIDRIENRKIGNYRRK